MKKSLPLLSAPRPVWFATTFFAVVVGCWLLAPSGFSQAPGTATNNAALIPFLTKLKAQQDQMAANETKIEAQLAQVKEDVRLTKIYASRAGGHH